MNLVTMLYCSFFPSVWLGTALYIHVAEGWKLKLWQATTGHLRSSFGAHVPQPQNVTGSVGGQTAVLALLLL